MGERNLRFLPPIPKGWRIWAKELEVVGISHRIDNASAFAQANDQSLTLEPEPTNKHDPNAVKVIGWAQRKGVFERYFLGYLPREIAANLPARVRLRLKNVWQGGYHKPVVYIRLDLLCRN